MLVGRESEITQLLGAFEKARAGSGGIIMIAGDSGIGKTTLARGALSQSRFIQFYGRAVPEAKTPYGLLAGALRDGLGKVSAKAVDENPLKQHLSVLLPEIGAAAEERSGELIREAVVNTIVSAANEGFICLYLEDIHWADSATLEMLPHLAERFIRERILILATYRNDEISREHPVRLLRNDLRRARLFQEIALQPLDRTASGKILTEIFGDELSDSLVSSIHEQTQGIPMFVEELGRTLKAGEYLHRDKSGLELATGLEMPLPESIRDAILLRFEGLTPEARQQLEAAAIIGAEFDLELLVKLSGTEEGLEELFRKKFLEEISNGKIQFRHTLICEAMKSETTWTRRRNLHRAVGEYLERNGAPAEAIAEHWLACQENVKARRALMESARASCKVHAFRDSARSANRALEIWPVTEDVEERLALLENFAHCAKVSGQLHDSVRAYKELAENETVKRDLRRYAEIMRSLATVYGLQGAWNHSTRVRRGAAAAFAGLERYEDASSEWLAVASRECASLRLNDAAEAIEKSLQLVKKTERRDIEARALGLRGYIQAMRGLYDDGMKSAQEALSLALSINDAESASDAYRRLAGAMEYSSDYTGSREAYFTAINYCRASEIDFQAKLCMGCMAWILFRLGEWNRALDICKDVLADGDPPRGTLEAAQGLAGLIRALRGETKSARKYLRECLAASRREQYEVFLLLIPWGEAVIQEIEGNYEQAAECYLEIIHRWHNTDDCHDVLAPACAAAAIFGKINDARRLSECIEVVSAIASKTGLNEAMAILAYALGENAMITGNKGEAAEKFAQAAEQFERLSLPLEYARALFRQGLALISLQDAVKGTGLIAEAANIAKKLGCRPLAAEISAVHDEDQVKPEKRWLSQGFTGNGLTRRQTEILRHLATGMTNREIAEKLFLSSRTVDMHVSNILERLNCRSRTEASQRARDLGLSGFQS